MIYLRRAFITQTWSLQAEEQAGDPQANECEYGDEEHQRHNDCNHLPQQDGVSWEGAIRAVHANFRIDKKRVTDEADYPRNTVKGENVNRVTNVLPGRVLGRVWKILLVDRKYDRDNQMYIYDGWKHHDVYIRQIKGMNKCKFS